MEARYRSCGQVIESQRVQIGFVSRSHWVAMLVKDNSAAKLLSQSVQPALLVGNPEYQVFDHSIELAIHLPKLSHLIRRLFYA